MAVTTNSGHYPGGPTQTTSIAVNVATAGVPLTTGSTTVLAAQGDAGFHSRALMVNWTGDQTLDLLIQYDLGTSTGNGLQTVARIHMVAGNGTAQTALFYASAAAGAPAATSLISGTAPTFAASPAIANAEWLRAPADRIQIVAIGGGTTTVGALTIDLQESV